MCGSRLQMFFISVGPQSELLPASACAGLGSGWRSLGDSEGSAPDKRGVFSGGFGEWTLQASTESFPPPLAGAGGCWGHSQASFPSKLERAMAKACRAHSGYR